MSETAIQSTTPVEDTLRSEIVKKLNSYKTAATSIPFSLVEKLNIVLQENKEIFRTYGNIYPGIVASDKCGAYANVNLQAKTGVIPRDAIKLLLKVLGGTFKRVEQTWNTTTSEWNWIPKGQTAETAHTVGLSVAISTGLPQTCTVERTEKWIPADPGCTHVDPDGQIMIKTVTNKVVCTNDKEVS